MNMQEPKRTPRGPDKKPRKPRGKNKAKLEEARDLVEGHGLSQTQAAKVLGISKSAISLRLAGFTDKKALESWKEKKADVMEAIQAKMLLSLDSDTIKGLIERRGLVDYGILFDKARIQRGEATDIVDFRGFLEHSLAELADRRRALEAQIVDVTPTYKDQATDLQSNDIGINSQDGQPAGLEAIATSGPDEATNETPATGPHGTPTPPRGGKAD